MWKRAVRTQTERLKDDLIWKNKRMLCLDFLSNCSCKQGLIDLVGSLRCHDGADITNVKKAIGWICKTTTLQVHRAFLYISFPLMNDYDVKMYNFTFCRGRKQGSDDIFFLFLNFDVVFRNLALKEFACIWYRKRVGIIATKIEKTRIPFLSGVSVAVAVRA